MASEVVREVAGRRFAAEAPGLPGVIAYGETAWQAQMRAAVVALRAIVLDGASDRAPPGNGAVRSSWCDACRDCPERFTWRV
jgi:hypothetical protein